MVCQRRAYFHEGGELVVYHWDGRDGEDFAGWWCGEGIGTEEVLGFCKSSAQKPPATGWQFPAGVDAELSIRFDTCDAPLGPALQSCAQRQWELVEQERQREVAEEARRHRAAAEQKHQRIVELFLAGRLPGRPSLEVPPWVHGGLGIHLFLSGTLTWEREKRARLDFFGTEWKVADGWAFGYGLGLQALEAEARAAGGFEASVQFRWGQTVKMPECVSLYEAGVTPGIAHFLASFFAKHEGRVLISGHSEGVAYALLLFRALQEAADEPVRHVRFRRTTPDAIFRQTLAELAQGPDPQAKLQEWAQNARALVTGPLAVGLTRDWAEYCFVRHHAQVAGVISSVAMNVDSPDGSGPWEGYFQSVCGEQRMIAKNLGRIPDLLYSLSHGQGRCLADARVRAIFEAHAFLLEARLSNLESDGGYQAAGDQGRVLHRGLDFLRGGGPSLFAAEPTCSSDGKKIGACWELHQLGAYRSIARLLFEALGGPAAAAKSA